ncbi:MAG: S-adenosylmethionine:tRNA ribosyltransferase-isomerase, partial [Acidimicrobiales bacterium]
MDVPDYDLPPSAIAQVPAARRDAARLLVALDGAVRHQRVADLPSLVGPGDLLVVNTSRVVPARLALH